MTAASRADNLRGAFLMMASMAGFTFNDACLKFVAQDMPVFQAVFIRGLIVSAFLILLAYAEGAMLRIPRAAWGRVALRTAAELCAFLPFVIALTLIPLANLMAILQALPLTLTFVGTIFLGETVGWRRWTAIAVGFIGVLLIVQPGLEGFNSASLFGVAAVFAITLRDLLTRNLAKDVPSVTVAVITAFSVMGLGFVGSFFQPRVPVSLPELSIIALAALFIAAGYLTSVMVMRVGDIGFVAPFRYTAILWGLLLGIAVFDEFPDALTLVGAGLITATGLFTLWRERRAG